MAQPQEEGIDSRLVKVPLYKQDRRLEEHFGRERFVDIWKNGYLRWLKDHGRIGETYDVSGGDYALTSFSLGPALIRAFCNSHDYDLVVPADPTGLFAGYVFDLFKENQRPIVALQTELGDRYLEGLEVAVLTHDLDSGYPGIMEMLPKMAESLRERNPERLDLVSIHGDSRPVPGYDKVRSGPFTEDLLPLAVNRLESLHPSEVNYKGSAHYQDE